MAKNRQTIDLNDRDVAKLEKLAENAASKAEVMRNALRVYEWFLREQQEGNAIYVKETGSEQFIKIHFIES